MPPEIDVQLHHEADRKLISDCALTLNKQCKKVDLRNLSRHGYSGSQLYVAYFANGNRGRPYVAKLNRLSTVDKELAAANRVQVYFQTAGVKTSQRNTAAKRGVLVYPLIGTEPDGTAVRTLEDEIKDRVGSAAQDKRLSMLIRKLYERQCASAHRVERKERQLGHEHKRYRRAEPLRDLAGERLAALYGPRPTNRRRNLFGADVRDPRYAIDKLTATKVELSVADAVHGDLHGSNVLIDAAGEPQLIDFAWGQCSSHVLKDYVLLECSLRFFLFPDDIDFDVQRKMDRALLDEAGHERLLALGDDAHLHDHYRRMGEVLGATRQMARQAAGEYFDFDEYLACQLWVLYGLLKYDTYRFHVAARALGMIANHVLNRYA